MNPTFKRRARAVLLGLAAVIALTTLVDIVLHATAVFPAMGQPMSNSLWWLAIGYRVAFTLLGGWLTAKLDAGSPMVSVWIATGIGTVLGLLGVAAAMGKPEMGPAWYAWGVALTGPPSCLLGGWLKVRQA